MTRDATDTERRYMRYMWNEARHLILQFHICSCHFPLVLHMHSVGFR
jgi:hypothetical protein